MYDTEYIKYTPPPPALLVPRNYPPLAEAYARYDAQVAEMEKLRVYHSEIKHLKTIKPKTDAIRQRMQEINPMVCRYVYIRDELREPRDHNMVAKVTYEHHLRQFKEYMVPCSHDRVYEMLQRYAESKTQLAALDHNFATAAAEYQLCKLWLKTWIRNIAKSELVPVHAYIQEVLNKFIREFSVSYVNTARVKVTIRHHALCTYNRETSTYVAGIVWSRWSKLERKLLAALGINIEPCDAPHSDSLHHWLRNYR